MAVRLLLIWVNFSSFQRNYKLCQNVQLSMLIKTAAIIRVCRLFESFNKKLLKIRVFIVFSFNYIVVAYKLVVVVSYDVTTMLTKS